MPDLPHSWTPEDCLVAVMIATSASDETIRTAELVAIQAVVNHLPVFASYDADRMRSVSQAVFDLFAEEEETASEFTREDGTPSSLFCFGE